MQCDYIERPISFLVEGHELYGIETMPSVPNGIAVIIVVGGPQYRVGSHRQFVLLARYLGKHGILVLRFDYTGMGYSNGLPKQFYEIDDDIFAAIDFVEQHRLDINSIYLWGLCDAAAAIAFCVHLDRRINGVVLLNPWVRSEASHSKVMLTKYYKSRFLDLQNWKIMFGSPYKILAAVRSLGSVFLKLTNSRIRNLKRGSLQTITQRTSDIAAAMYEGLVKYKGKICIILSENDLTAAEFRQVMQDNHWMSDSDMHAKTQVFEIAESTHTFSSQKWRSNIEQLTLEFVLRCQKKS
jgi:exosortase A-associated hydrolase 1